MITQTSSGFALHMTCQFWSGYRTIKGMIAICPLTDIPRKMANIWNHPLSLSSQRWEEARQMLSHPQNNMLQVSTVVNAVSREREGRGSGILHWIRESDEAASSASWGGGGASRLYQWLQIFCWSECE